MSRKKLLATTLGALLAAASLAGCAESETEPTTTARATPAATAPATTDAQVSQEHNDADTTFESNGDVLEAVNNGDVAIGLINHYYWARHENRDQLEAKLVFPSGEDPGGLVNATAVAVTPAGAENEAALTFVNYLLSDEGQETFVHETWEYPVVSSVADPEGIPPLEDLDGPSIDLADLDSLEETQALLTELGLLG